MFKEPLNNAATNNKEKITPIITQKLFDDASIRIKQLNNKIFEREINYIDKDKAIYLNSKVGFLSLHIELTNELGFRFNNNHYFYISIPTSCELHLKNKISQLSNVGFEITYPQRYYDLFGKENTYRISWL